MLQTSLFYLPTVGSREEIEQGMAGVRDDLYQKMLAELTEQAQLADRLGYDSISFTEHHFHIEGFELSTNPVLLDLYIAMQTERIRVGQLGIVLPAQNPIRVAEDIAMLDQMSGGRAIAGFARGYQRRWVDVMAQQMHGIHGAIPQQHDEIDAANRKAFEEHFNIVRRCWTEEMLDTDSSYWTIPTEGTPWTLEATRLWGKGVDEDGMLRQIGVVPKPLQKPHPPIFQPFASSEGTVRWCAREGITAVVTPMHPVNQRKLLEAYKDEATAAGRELAPGEGIGLLRDVFIADTDEEAYELWRRGAGFAHNAWFSPFGFGVGRNKPGTDEAMTPQEMMDLGMLLVGTVDSVTRQLEAMVSHDPVDWLFAWQFNGLIPHDKLMRSLELFATKVLPRVNGGG